MAEAKGSQKEGKFTHFKSLLNKLVKAKGTFVFSCVDLKDKGTS